jgi:hypothetical protein
MTTPTYRRTCRLDSGAELGIVSGILATDGEASDGHVLSIKGGVAEPGVPLLFGHDAFSGRANLGSWTQFRKTEHELRGQAQIELGGIGAQADWRADLAHMIAQDHVNALSVRWDPIETPVRRINLPSDHPAFVDPEAMNHPGRWGMFFKSWRVLEGSVVTLGADPAALIGRLAAARGADRELWRGAIADYFADGAAAPELRAAYTALAGAVEMLRTAGIDDFGTLLRLCGCGTDVSSLVAVEYGEGRRVLIPREAHDRLTGSARERLELAFDLLADALPPVDGLLEPAAAPEIPAPALPPARASEVPAAPSAEVAAQTFMAALDRELRESAVRDARAQMGIR